MKDSIRLGTAKLSKGVLLAVVAVVASTVFSADFYSFKGESGGKEGTAAAMRGVNYPGLQTFSACAWVRNLKAARETELLNNFAVILSQGALGRDDGFCVYLNSSGVLSFQTRHDEMSRGLTATVPSLLADDGVWHLVGVTHDWENKVKRIWVDGKVCAEETASENLPDPSTDGYDFCLGARHGMSTSGVGIDYPLTGDMTEVSLWNVVLTADDFAKLLTARVDSAATGLIGYWPLDDKCGSGTDKSAGGYDLQAVGVPGMWDGDASVVYQRGNPDALKIAKGSYGLATTHQYNLSTFSACAWIKNPPTPTSTEKFGVIMSQGGLGEKAGWTVYIKGETGELTFQTRDDSKNDNLSISKDVVQDGLWHSIVVTHDWNNKVKRLYVDGRLRAEQTDVSSFYNPTPTATRYFAIGTRHLGTKYEYSCAGSYAHVSLWDKALTEEEVRALHVQVPVGNEPNLVGYWPLNDGATGPFADLAGNNDATILGGAAGYSVDPVPFYERQAQLLIDGIGSSGFSLRAHAVGQTGEVSAKVVWGPESAPQLHTNDLGLVTLPDFSAEVSHGIFPQATYLAQTLVTTAGGVVCSPIVRFAAPNSSVLDSAYQRLSYIESSGTQMIDTKYLPNTTTRVQMSFELSPVMDRTSGGKVGQMLGCVEGSSAFMCNIGGNVTEDDALYCWLDKTSASGADKKILTVTADIRTNRNEFCIEASTGEVSWGTKSITAAVKTTVHTTKTKTMGLFGRNNDGALTPFTYAHMRLYACKIFDNGNLVRNFVPCRELAGERRTGLYDLVGEEFYPNAAGTDDFLTEADVTVLYPLTITSRSKHLHGPVAPDYGTLYVPAGADIPLAALADVDPENPKAKFRGWNTFEANDKGDWEPTGAGMEKSVLFAQPAAPAKFSWDWGGMGLIIVIE